MTSFFTCGHKEKYNEYTDKLENGSHALWEAYDDDGDIVMCYGVLCYECIPIYGARECGIGGIENDL